jgi:hypothetical protein
MSALTAAAPAGDRPGAGCGGCVRPRLHAAGDAGDRLAACGARRLVLASDRRVPGRRRAVCRAQGPPGRADESVTVRHPYAEERVRVAALECAWEGWSPGIPLARLCRQMGGLVPVDG